MNPLLAVSDVVWQAGIAAVVTVVLAWMQQRTKNSLSEHAAATKTDIADVRTFQIDRAIIEAKRLNHIAETDAGKITVIDEAVRQAYAPLIDDVHEFLEKAGLPADCKSVEAFWQVMINFRAELLALCEKFSMSEGACAINAIALADEKNIQAST